MNAEEYEHIWFWEQPKLFCETVKKKKSLNAKEFAKRYSIDILKQIKEKNRFSKN